MAQAAEGRPPGASAPGGGAKSGLGAKPRKAGANAAFGGVARRWAGLR
jgi:hypothetical protein